MSDMSVALAHRATASDAPHAIPSPAAPLGVWTTIAWGAAGVAGILSVWLAFRAGLGVPLVLQSLPTAHIVTAIVVVAAVWTSGRRLREYLALKPLTWGDAGRGIGYGVLGYIGFIVILGLLTMLQVALGGAAPSGAGFGKMQFGIELMLFLLSYWMLLVVAAPIVEEMLFRGFLYRGLTPRLGAVGTIILTSVVFGLLHAPGFGWVRVVGTTCLGLLLGWLRWRTDNTSVSIVTHTTMNFLAALLGTAMMLGTALTQP
jgi:membrane protease YdiL (CAAX protease family)